MAERKKAATKKAAEKKPKNEKPAVLGGAVPEYANATAISKLLGKSPAADPGRSAGNRGPARRRGAEIPDL